jgi:iron complex transport system substrate-binding protein
VSACLLALQLAVAGTLHGADGHVVRVGAPERIVTLGGGLTSTVHALGLGPRLVAVDASSLHPVEVTELPQVGYYRQVGAEGILAMSPDLVVASADAGPPAAIEQLRSAGVPVVRLDATPSFAAAMQRIRDLAALLDRPDEGAALVQAARDARDARCQPPVPPRVAFLFGRGAGNLVVAGSETAADAIIQLAGGTNAVSGYEGYRPLASESLLLAAPEVLLTTERVAASVGGPEALARRPEIAATPAGRAGRIVVMDDLELLGFDHRVGDAAQRLSEELCP